MLGSPIPYYPRRQNRRKGKTPRLDDTQVFQCLGHSNWTICRRLSQFCSSNFQTFSLSYWGPILITPERGRLKMGKWKYPNLSETKVFQCLGHSNWTICRRLSHFCSTNLPIFQLLSWEANSYYPREGQAEKRKMEFSING